MFLQYGPIFNEVSVKSRRKRNGLREGSCVAALETVQAFFVEHCRDAEARLFKGASLQYAIFEQRY